MVHLVLVLIQVLFATLAIAGKLALRELPPASLVLLRVGGAALVLAAILDASRQRGIRGRGDYLRLALYSLLGVVVNQLLFVEGLARTTAINATILVTTVPVFTLGLALATGAERATVPKVAGLVLALAGALALIDPGRLDVSRTVGNAMILANAFSYSVYLVLSKPMLDRYAPITLITWVFLFGALGLVPFGVPALARTDTAAIHPETWLVVLYIILVPTIATYWLSLWALKRVESSLVAMYIYIQPLVTMLIAPAVLGERIGVGTLAAGAAIFAGLALATFARRTRKAQEAILETDV